MSGVYARNKLFDDFCWIGAEYLPVLEDDIHTCCSVDTTPFEDYEVTLEETWPDFIKDSYA